MTDKRERDAQLDEAIDRVAGAAGGDRQQLEAILRENPRFAPMLRRMKPTDLAKLRQILADPAAAERMLATPGAQQLLASIKKSGERR